MTRKQAEEAVAHVLGQEAFDLSINSGLPRLLEIAAVKIFRDDKNPWDDDAVVIRNALLMLHRDGKLSFDEEHLPERFLLIDEVLSDEQLDRLRGITPGGRKNARP